MFWSEIYSVGLLLLSSSLWLGRNLHFVVRFHFLLHFVVRIRHLDFIVWLRYIHFVVRGLFIRSRARLIIFVAKILHEPSLSLLLSSFGSFSLFLQVLHQLPRCVENTISRLPADEAIRVGRVVPYSASVTEIVLTLCYYGVIELTFTDWTWVWEASSIITTTSVDFIVALLATVTACIGIPRMALKPHLFSLQSLLVFLVELMPTLVVTSIVDEDASVSKAAIAMLVVVFASLGVMIDPCCHFDESWSFLRTFQRPRELLLPQVIFSLNEVVRVAILSTIHFWI